MQNGHQRPIDAMIPIGLRGQRELMHRRSPRSGKTRHRHRNTILTKKRRRTLSASTVRSVQKSASWANGGGRARERAAPRIYTVVVAPSALGTCRSSSSGPLPGAAIAEYFMYRAKATLVVYETTSQHAQAYPPDVAAAAPNRPGVKAYPAMFSTATAACSERAARVSDAMGKGSWPPCRSSKPQAGDVSAYIPTNSGFRSTDGQIFSASDLFKLRPTASQFNVGMLGEPGSAPLAQTKAIKRSPGTLKLEWPSV